MTFREKLKEDWPDHVDPRYKAGCQGCPKSYDYEKDYHCADKMTGFTIPPSEAECRACWNREMPDDAVTLE